MKKKNTGVYCHALLQGIFSTLGLNPGLPNCMWIFYCLSHQGNPVVFPTFFNLSLNFSRRSHGLSQSAPGLVFTDCIELLHLWLKEYKQSEFDVDHLVMSMCRVFFCVVGRGCLLWPVHSPGKTLLAFALLHFVLQGQTCLLNPGISWLPTFVFHSPMMKRMFFLVLVLEGLVGLHSSNSASSALAVGAQTWITVILNDLPWKQMIEIILSFLRLYPSTAFQALLLTMSVTPFLLRDSCPQ